MMPPAAARVCGKTALLSGNGAVGFTAMTRCQSAAGNSSAGPGASVAAALISTRPRLAAGDDPLGGRDDVGG